MAYRVGRYEVHDPVASGGMAVVHLGRVVGPAGFSRTVAVKRLHPHLATDPDFVAMFLDEARLAARVQHPNVAAMLDVVAGDGQLFLVMDFVLGAALSQLVRSAREDDRPPPPAVVSSILAGALYGLHAAHEARDESGGSLGVVHRDVSPQNLLVGLDGVTRVVDFGVAKAASRGQATRDGQLKGKLAYMSPEQILRTSVDRRADVYAAGVVLWEALTLERLFQSDDEGGVMAAVLEGSVPPLSALGIDLPPAVDELIAHALARDPAARFATAQDFAAALEERIPPAPQGEVGAWVARAGGGAIEERRRLVAAVERSPALEARGGADATVEGLLQHRLTEQEERQLATALTASLPARAIADAETAAAEAHVPPRSRRARRVGVWAVGGLAAIAMGAVLYPRAAPRASHEPPPAIPATIAASDAPSPPSEVAPIAAVPPLPASPGPAVATSALRPAARPAARVPTRPQSSARTSSCDPPFTVDSQGVKRFKSWCL